MKATHWKAQLREATEAEARGLGLTSKEFKRIGEVLKRAPNVIEVGVFSAMWSEHCSYKTSKSFLKRLPTDGPHVVVKPGENAGAVAIDAEHVAVFKMESHNHPSAIEPFHGAATGVGGILRDVFTMGARPVANLNVLFFGDRNREPTPYLSAGCVSGIAFYGNCMGIPTVGGQTTYDEAYQHNILVNAMTVGVARKDGLFFGLAPGAGNILVIFGNLTGPDGVHGASMASQVFSSGAEKPRPAVQVADPFREKLLLEATLELMANKVMVGIQDMGAAGIISSSVEMAERSGTGVRLDLDKVPLRVVGEEVTPFEILLSESQERMLMVIEPGRLSEAERILRKWDLPCAVIGEVTDTKLWECRFKGETVARLTLEALREAAPPRATERRARVLKTTPRVRAVSDLTEGIALVSRWLESQELSSHREVFERYDHMVGMRTVFGPGHNAAVVRFLQSSSVNDGPAGTVVSMTAGVRTDWCALDPLKGAAWNVLHHVQRHRAVGCEARGLTDCLNFGNPEIPEILWEFEQCIEGVATACRELSVPVVSGNVSLYNATDGRNIPPTPALGVVGVGAEKRVFPSVASKTGDHVYRVCHSGESTLGGSLFARIYKEVLQLSDFSWERERALLSFIKDLQEVGAVQSCRAVGSGGLLGTMPSFLINSESFGLGSIVGLHWDAEFEQDLRHLSPLERAELLFGEQNGGFLIASAWAPPRFRDVFLHHPGGLRYEYLGRLATEPMMKWSVGAQPLMDWQKNFLRGCQR